MKRKLYLETFGCQMNALDSELVVNQLRAIGYESVSTRDDADVVLYNTCSVREHAEQKVWSRLGELRETKAARPHLVIGVIGCMAERDNTALFRKFPYVDLICGPGELDKLPSLIQSATIANSVAVPTDNPRFRVKNHFAALMGKTTRRSSTQDAANDGLEQLDLSRSFSPTDGSTQAYVRITRGCNKFCSYCVVPYTRGAEVHRPPENIVAEVKRLADGGFLEVTLLGQTVNHYAYKHGDGRTTAFADLLYQVHEAVPQLPRLRFVTSYPRDFTDQALQVMRDCSRICHYLHIPAQSGSDRLLKLMNRGYSVGEYRDLIDRAREMMPDISLASDFIVGFPTETDDEFQETVALLKHCRFKNSFIFKYSPRPGTRAAQQHPDDVPDETKRKRNTELLAVQGEVCVRNNAAMIGQTLQIILEGEGSLAISHAAANKPAPAWETASNNIRQLLGRTRGDQIVAVNADRSLLGKMVNVKITDARQMTLFGELPCM